MGNKFTVLLLYPDYLCDGAQETYLAHVEAETPAAAAQAARTMAGEDNQLDADADLMDFRLLFTAAGHLDDLCSE